MGHRYAKEVAVVLTGAAVALPSVPAYAAGNPVPVPIFNDWTFSQWFPALFEQATEAYNAIGPIAWLVMGALLAGIVIEELFRVIWAARRGADDEELDID